MRLQDQQGHFFVRVCVFVSCQKKKKKKEFDVVIGCRVVCVVGVIVVVDVVAAP